MFPAQVVVSLDAVLTLWRPVQSELLALKAASVIGKFCRLQLMSLVKTLYGYVRRNPEC